MFWGSGCNQTYTLVTAAECESVLECVRVVYCSPLASLNHSDLWRGLQKNETPVLWCDSSPLPILARLLQLPPLRIRVMICMCVLLLFSQLTHYDLIRFPHSGWVCLFLRRWGGSCVIFDRCCSNFKTIRCWGIGAYQYFQQKCRRGNWIWWSCTSSGCGCNPSQFIIWFSRCVKSF